MIIIDINASDICIIGKFARLSHEFRTVTVEKIIHGRKKIVIDMLAHFIDFVVVAASSHQ